MPRNVIPEPRPPTSAGLRTNVPNPQQTETAIATGGGGQAQATRGIASSLLIEELTGPGLKPGRLVELIGPGLPKQGASWDSTQRIKTTWYAGNARASQQITGSTELPSTWEGTWRSIRMLQTPSKFTPAGGANPINISRAYDLRDVLDSMFLDAALLHVTWVSNSSAKDGLKVERFGRATNWKFPHERMDDINWSIEFTWVSRTLGEPGAVQLKGDANQASKMEQLTALTNDILKTMKENALFSRRASIPRSANSLDIGDLEALADAPQALVDSVGRSIQRLGNDIQQTADLVAKVRDLPASLQERIDQITANTLAQTASIQQTLGQKGAHWFRTKGDVSAARLAKAKSYFNTVDSGMKKLEKEALAIAREMKKNHNAGATGTAGKNRSSADDMLAVHVVHEGETFASISLKYYQTTEGAGDIARANGFPSYQTAPPKGTLLIIPKLKAFARQRTA